MNFCGITWKCLLVSSQVRSEKCITNQCIPEPVTSLSMALTFLTHIVQNCIELSYDLKYLLVYFNQNIFLCCFLGWCCGGKLSSRHNITISTACVLSWVGKN